jgi:hypothetical protein
MSRKFVWRAFKASLRLSCLMTLWLCMTLIRFKKKWS